MKTSLGTSPTVDGWRYMSEMSDNRFLMGGSPGSFGGGGNNGDNSSSITITSNNLPKHNHNVSILPHNLAIYNSSINVSVVQDLKFDAQIGHTGSEYLYIGGLPAGVNLNDSVNSNPAGWQFGGSLWRNHASGHYF